MNVNVPDNKLKRALEDDKEAQKRFGKVMAKKIRSRMDALVAAETLADFWPPLSAPERCHALVGNLAGIFSMDLEHPNRLLFKDSHAATRPPETALTENVDEKQRWMAIREIDITEIRDTHD